MEAMLTYDLSEDQEYFAKRADEELIKAATCEDNAVARAHLKMADEYKRRVQELAQVVPIRA